MRKRWLMLVAVATMLVTSAVTAATVGAATADGTGPGQQGRRVHLRRTEGRLRLQPGRVRGLAGGQEGVSRSSTCITAENVPEDDSAARVMEGMISRGAKIIFATSYGHLDAAVKVAKAHPDVAVVQQGNFIKGTITANEGTFFGTVYEPVYLAGIAAGHGDEERQARLRVRVPDPADHRQHQRVRARRPVGEPEGEDLHGQHLDLV